MKKQILSFAILALMFLSLSSFESKENLSTTVKKVEVLSDFSFEQDAQAIIDPSVIIYYIINWTCPSCERDYYYNNQITA